MSQFNRERFLFYLLGAVLAVNALFFGFGLFACSRSGDPTKTCPNIGARFDNYSEKALAAVLGLIAGAAALSTSTSKRESSNTEDNEEALITSLPQHPSQPHPKRGRPASPKSPE